MIAGVTAGFLAALMQLTFTVPLLMEGELFETGARIHFSATGTPQSDAGSPAIWDDIGRHVGTLGMNLVSYSGFAFLLVAGFALAERFGHTVTPRNGAIWGLCGFIAINLAPSFGLPPEMPGAISADLAMRQAWWIGCVGATIIALSLFAFGRGLWPMIAGSVLIVLPHLIGAPTIETYYGVAAPELAAHFVARSLGVAAASWVLLGLFAAALYSKRD